MTGGAARPAVVFVHGLWMPGLELAWLRRRVSRAGFDTRQFRYSTVRDDLDANAASLLEFARRIEAPALHFVGYSLGGLVALTMLSRYGTRLERGRVVLIGAPVRGSAAARGLCRRRWGRRMLGEAVCLLKDHQADWRGERELGVIAGTRSIGMGKLVGLDDIPNDGTVATAETRLENATDHIELPLTHATLMFSSRVAEATVAFLQTGRFGESDQAGE